jgi:putative iron-only hydrogenase system regulator
MTESPIPGAERIGVLALFVADPASTQAVNQILAEYARQIIGRIGLPHIQRQREVAVIALIFQGSTDEVGALSGRLGQLSGVEVKSLLSKRF